METKRTRMRVSPREDGDSANTFDERSVRGRTLNSWRRLRLVVVSPLARAMETAAGMFGSVDGDGCVLMASTRGGGDEIV